MVNRTRHAPVRAEPHGLTIWETAGIFFYGLSPFGEEFRCTRVLCQGHFQGFAAAVIEAARKQDFSTFWYEPVSSPPPDRG